MRNWFCSSSPVAELVDIVRKAETDSKAGHVVDGGENIINDDVVRDQLVMACGELLFELLFVVAARFENLGEHCVAHTFVDAALRLCIKGNVFCDIDHTV